MEDERNSLANWNCCVWRFGRQHKEYIVIKNRPRALECKQESDEVSKRTTQLPLIVSIAWWTLVTEATGALSRSGALSVICLRAVFSTNAHRSQWRGFLNAQAYQRRLPNLEENRHCVRHSYVVVIVVVVVSSSTASSLCSLAFASMHLSCHGFWASTFIARQKSSFSDNTHMHTHSHDYSERTNMFFSVLVCVCVLYSGRWL